MLNKIDKIEQILLNEVKNEYGLEIIDISLNNKNLEFLISGLKEPDYFKYNMDHLCFNLYFQLNNYDIQSIDGVTAFIIVNLEV